MKKLKISEMVPLLLAVLLIPLYVASVHADPPVCDQCECLLPGDCGGCQAAFPPGGGTQLGVYVSLGSIPYYQCETTGGDGECYTGTLVCWSIPAGQRVNIYTDNTCATLSGTAPGPLQVTTEGCSFSAGGA